MASVFVGVPTHGGSISGGTATAIRQAAQLSDHHVHVETIGLSLLARCFNTLFISAYESKADYFCLLHADTQPIRPPVVQPLPAWEMLWDGISFSNWLDALVEQLQTYELRAMSVATPIKSEAGFLSAGFDFAPAGDAHCLRRMTMHELSQCQVDTIFRNDAAKVMNLDPNTCGAFLINSGCMIMDMSFDWLGAGWEGFGIIDSIGRNSSGQIRCFTESEDWRFSRWMHENNVPYAMSKRLPLLHHGNQAFNNWDVWGADCDRGPYDIAPQDWKEM